MSPAIGLSTSGDALFVLMPAPVALPALVDSVTTICEFCEEGGVLVGQGQDWEHYQNCKVCSGQGSTTQYRCETCDELVSEHQLDAAGVCLKCFQEGLRAVEEEPEYELWCKEQIDFGRSVGWL